MKVCEILNGLGPGEKFFSIEVFPPRTEDGTENLVDRVIRLRQLGAVFVSVTWGAGGSHADQSIGLATRIQKQLNVPVVLHLTCTNMDRSLLDAALQAADEAGIDNILALRGDPPRCEYTKTSGLICAADLVTYIKEKYGSRFSIGVAGYPEGHCFGAASQQSVDLDLPYLEAKVRAGADFIITQMFYDVQAFVDYEKRLRSMPSGLFANMPIIPGLMPINSYSSFLRSAKLSHASIPASLEQQFDQINVRNDSEVKELGINYLCSSIKALFDAGVPGVHFYTLNLERSVSQAVLRCGLYSETDAMDQDGVRTPVAQQDTSVGNAHWDEFTNGRYTDPSSAAFGEIDGYGPVVHGVENNQPSAEWGKISTVHDISTIFVNHITGQVSVIPFSNDPLSRETLLIQEQLITLNSEDKWTLASQPGVDGADSLDEAFGWGEANGLIYQKPFVEFFVSPEQWQKLKPRLDACGSALKYFYGKENQPIMYSGDQSETTVQVTWGVWGSEKIVSTQISLESVSAWKDEAFSIMRAWQAMYPTLSTDYEVLKNAADTRIMVSVVCQTTCPDDCRQFWNLLVDEPVC